MLYLKDIHNLKFKSENEFIMMSIKEMLSLIPHPLRNRIVLLADRQFGTKMLMKFFKNQDLRFIVRVRKDLKVDISGNTVKTGELKKGKYMVNISEEMYYLYVRTDGREKLLLVSNFEGRDSLRESRKYLKRSYCEQMHRDLKSRLKLLYLNSRYYKSLDGEKVVRYLIIFMIAEIAGIWIGRLVKRSDHYHKFSSNRDERSLFHLGQIVLRRIWEFFDLCLRLKISASKLFLYTGGISM